MTEAELFAAVHEFMHASACAYMDNGDHELAARDVDRDKLLAAIRRWSTPELGAIRTGRPEHLTLEAAERHAQRLRDLAPSEVTLVGRLLVVMHNEVLRLGAKLALMAALPERMEAYHQAADNVSADFRAGRQAAIDLYAREVEQALRGEQ